MSSIRGIFLTFLLAFSLFSVIGIMDVSAQEKSIEANSVGFEETTIIEFENNGSDDIETIRLWLGSDFSFKSFKTEKGWTGNKTPQGVLVFTTSSPVKEGDSVKFGIKTDKPKPGINWKALDKSDVQIQIGKTLVGDLPIIEDENGSTKTGQKSETGILTDSSFRLIPEKPNVGSTIRVTGDNFGSNHELDFYLEDKRLDSFETDENGHFMFTSKIPDDAESERVNFIIKDDQGNEKTISLRLGEGGERRVSEEEVTLAIENLPSVMYRGDVLLLSGTGLPGGSVTATITNPEGEVLTTNATDVEPTGKWTFETIVPLDAPLGKYSATISDGKDTILRNWTIESSQKIQILPTKLKFDPGDIVTFNGTVIPNQDIAVTIENPQGVEVFSDVIVVDKSGFVEIEFETLFSDLEGTYILFASQGEDTAITLVGLGELPQEQLIVKLDQLNYKAGDKAIITIDGPPSSTLSLLIVDPSDKNKFSDTVVLGPDGKRSYELDLTAYSSGVYTIVLTRGNAQASDIFSVGLQTGSGPIEVRTTKSEYLQGDPVLVLGNSGQNILLTLSLIDPEGEVVKEKETFTNKEGVLSEDSFRIPNDAEQGTWTIRAESGSNFDIVEFTVLTTIEEGMTVLVEKIEPSPTGKLVYIKGFGGAPSQNIVIFIFDPEGEEIAELQFSSSGTGDFSTIWPVPSESPPGTYLIIAEDAFDSAQTTFVLE